MFWVIVPWLLAGGVGAYLTYQATQTKDQQSSNWTGIMIIVALIVIVIAGMYFLSKE